MSLKKYIQTNPALALNEWTLKSFVPSLELPLDKLPVFNWELNSVATIGKDTFVLNFYECELQCRLEYEDTYELMILLKCLMEQLSMCGEIILENNSPLIFKRITIKQSSVKSNEGLILLTGNYSVFNVLNQNEDTELLLKANMKKVNSGV